MKALARRRAAPRPSRDSPRRGCRPGALKAWHYTDLRAAMADAAPLAAAPDRAAIEAARALARASRAFGVGARSSLLNGRFVAELERRPARAASSVASREDRTLERRATRWRALVEAMSPGQPRRRRGGGARSPSRSRSCIWRSARAPIRSIRWTEIALGAGARATFVETFLGAGPRVQRHAATTLTLARGARLKHVAVIGDEAELHLESQIVELRGGGGAERLRLRVGRRADAAGRFSSRIAGDRAKIALGGLALIDGTPPGRHDPAGRSRRAGGAQPGVLSRDRRRRGGRRVSGQGRSSRQARRRPTAR